MAKHYVILTEAEANKVNKDIKDNHDGVLDKFKKHGGWTLQVTAKLKNGKYTMSREAVEELQRRGGTNATTIGGVDLKNRSDVTVNQSERYKPEM